MQLTNVKLWNLILKCYQNYIKAPYMHHKLYAMAEKKIICE